MVHKVPFIVAELGRHVDPFMLHIYAACAEQERRKIAERTHENWNILSAKIEEAEPSASAKAPGSDDRSLSVALLPREVDHRAKNILSVVQAIAHQTQASSVQEFIARFDERIRSLRASHDLLVKSKWGNVPLAEPVRAQLAHFGPILDSRIILRGPDLTVTVAAAQSIGMALHELATNAGKYGSLSDDHGSVTIDWRLEDGQFSLGWIEHDGPRVRPPERRGCGSTIISALAEASVGGEVKLDYAPSGLMWQLTCPAAKALGPEKPEGNQEKGRAS
jgi:two-component sensor histidine kinase